MFLQKLFAILLEQPDGMRAGQALDKLASQVTLTEYEKGAYQSSDSRRFEIIVRFATVDCVKAGWLVKRRGVWAVTQEGADALKKYSDSGAFYREAVRLYRQWKAERAETLSPDKDLEKDIEKVDVEEKSGSVTFEQAEEQAWNEVERHLKGMDPYEFQELVADLLRAMGQYVAWVSPPGKDGGIDIVAYPDPLGTKPPRLKVQVKRRADQKVDTQEVQSFSSIITNDDAGLFISTSGFTKDAETLVRREHRKIMLIDLERFSELWTQFYDKLSDKARQRFPLTPIYFLTPET